MTGNLQGFYKAEFETARKKSHGVIFLRDGKIQGGDSTFLYVGAYSQNGLTVTGHLRGVRHSSDHSRLSVFGIEPFEVAFDGVAKDGYVAIEGYAHETPGLPMKAILTRIGD
ncbi:hypothetical protein DNX69_11945 [Rhodopseudomonas palustris]|uniref:T3SS negative regulator,GrlR n=1 Tax=Rhodopseudomonas palustris TaxID=1076 RepID=A0A323UHL9_RHOPL|nr:hypothetical protein [Rhodopseudomonas palustris]PZA11809.1 hypothetical protein DNX69_11945 [Rhodopseudomonas palustris]